MSFPTAPIVAGSLIGGYLVARETKVRPLGGAVALGVVYLGAFGASHPLAKKIGAWPAVLSAAGVSAAAAWVVSDRRA